VAGRSKHGNELSDYVKAGDFLINSSSKWRSSADLVCNLNVFAAIYKCICNVIDHIYIPHTFLLLKIGMRV